MSYMYDSSFSLFGYVPEGASIVLYGFGKRGRRFYEINERIRWCSIKCVLDETGGEYYILGEKVSCIIPEDFDYNDTQDWLFLVSLADKQINTSIVRMLMKKGVEYERIVPGDPKIANEQIFPEDFKVSFIIDGGIGDNIIYKKIILPIMEMINENDVFIFTGKVDVLRSLYGDIISRDRIRPIEEYKEQNYSLAFLLDWFPIVTKACFDKIRQYNKSLFNYVYMLLKYEENDSFIQNDNTMLRYNAYLRRAKNEGKTKYSFLDVNDYFGVNDQKVELTVDNSYLSRCEALGLGEKYITYGNGTDKFYIKGEVSNDRQIKQWPIEYHEKFNRLFKEKFPYIQLVQVGATDSETISGADKYIFGENFEVVKHILKNSLLHVDIDGGLVHLATQLGTKCIVLFGPTPEWFYGYPQNENIRCCSCDACMAMYDDWYIKCHKYEKPICMWQITPELVIKKIEENL